MSVITWVLRHPDSKVPTQGSSRAAGYDLSTVEEKTLLPGQSYAFSTGLSWSVPSALNVFMEIKPRSGLAKNYAIDTLAGVIDADFEGIIHVILINHGIEPVTFKVGDRIAQGVIHALPTIQTTSAELNGRVFNQSARGENGFGSTGLQ